MIWFGEYESITQFLDSVLSFVTLPISSLKQKLLTASCLLLSSPTFLLHEKPFNFLPILSKTFNESASSLRGLFVVRFFCYPTRFFAFSTSARLNSMSLKLGVAVDSPHSRLSTCGSPSESMKSHLAAPTPLSARSSSQRPASAPIIQFFPSAAAKSLPISMVNPHSKLSHF